MGDRRDLSGFKHLWDTNMRACHYPNNDTIIYTKGSVEGGRYMVDNQYFVCLDGDGLLEDAESHIDDELSSVDEFRRSKAQDNYLEFLGQPRNVDIREVTATDVSESAGGIKRVNPSKPSQDIDSYVNEIEQELDNGNRVSVVPSSCKRSDVYRAMSYLNKKIPDHPVMDDGGRKAIREGNELLAQPDAYICVSRSSPVSSDESQQATSSDAGGVFSGVIDRFT